MPHQHTPVLLKEVIEYLQPAKNQHFIDCTVGGGGHTKKILEKTAPAGKILAIDRDQTALAVSQDNLRRYKERVIFIHDSFAKLKQIYNDQFSSYEIHGILLDLGLSSLELQDKHRGFSFQIDGPLDMRFDARQSLTAAEIINTWPEKTLTKIFQEYGQEKLAAEIAKLIVVSRQKQKIKSTKQLVAAILLVYRKKLGSKKEIPWVGGRHPATKVFQALRIAVNDELNQVRMVLPQAVDILKKGGRVAVISFHSLEDKIVKDFFKRESQKCVCPPELPVCRCGHTASLKIITKKPITPSEQEIKNNPRASSAKLRVAQKII